MRRTESASWEEGDSRPVDVEVTATLRLAPEKIAEAGGSLTQAAQNLLGTAGAQVVEVARV